jgi:hypothetical protein
MEKDGRGRLQSCREEQVSLQALMAIKFDCMDLQLLHALSPASSGDESSGVTETRVRACARLRDVCF